MATLRIAAVGAPGAGKSALLAALAANARRPLATSEAASLGALGDTVHDLVLECVDVRRAIGRGAQDGGGRGGRGSYTGAFVRVFTKMDDTDGSMFDGDWDNVDPDDEDKVMWRNEYRSDIAFELKFPVTGGADASFAVSARTEWRLADLLMYVEALRPRAH